MPANRPALSDDVWLTAAQLAKIIGISTYTVYEMVKRGEGPRARRFGRQIRFAKSDVDEWMDKA
ncbi:excisionase [Corynebacterium xerosis]|uniref:Excisionase n=1 Tax=Corynebacterium xerosis TaxID=1725 RepID=A0A2N6T275_9CORY|nr:helix-turn-helix domain-containing protein [Corynebacterium xerosis]PMC63412.1 excisionase [Corynebacterium xerosis]